MMSVECQLTNAFDDYRRANFSHNCYWKAGGNVSSLRFGNTRTTKPSVRYPPLSFVTSLRDHKLSSLFHQ